MDEVQVDRHQRTIYTRLKILYIDLLAICQQKVTGFVTDVRRLLLISPSYGDLRSFHQTSKIKAVWFSYYESYFEVAWLFYRCLIMRPILVFFAAFFSCSLEKISHKNQIFM